FASYTPASIYIYTAVKATRHMKIKAATPCLTLLPILLPKYNDMTSNSTRSNFVCLFSVVCFTAPSFPIIKSILLIEDPDMLFLHYPCLLCFSAERIRLSCPPGAYCVFQHT